MPQTNPKAQDLRNKMTPQQKKNVASKAKTTGQKALVAGAVWKPVSTPLQPKQSNDIFGDFNKKPTAKQNTTGVMTSSGLQKKQTTYQDLWDLNARWAGTQWRKPDQFKKRNDTVAWNLFSEWKTNVADIEEYLKGQKWFLEASPEDQKNTLRAISNRIGILWEQSKQITPWSAEDTSGVDPDTGKPADWSWILWYNKLNDFEKEMLASMPWREQAIVDKLLEEDYSQAVTYLMKWKQSEEYLQDNREQTLKIKWKEGEILEIQKSSRLSDAQKQIDKIKQNYAYLGNMGAPWVSSTRLQAVADNIADAEQKFWEMKRLEILAAEMREIWLEIDTANYEKQMQDLTNELNDNVDRAIQNAMNDMSAADIAGNLDTVEWINKFRRSMLENLDKRINSYATGTYNQLIQLNTFAQKQIDDAQLAYDTFMKWQNTVNTEMSAIKWFYMDGNGNPILDDMWNPIKTPQTPLEDRNSPIFDKENGRLILFTHDENGERVVNVQNIGWWTATGTGWFWSPESKFAMDVMKAVNAWEMTMDQALTMFPSLAPALLAGQTQQQSSGWMQPVPEQTVQQALQQVLAQWDGAIWGQCGVFVNDYLQQMGLGRLFIDPIDDKLAVKNTDNPTIGSVAIIDRRNSPNASLAQQKYWHVGIVTAINKDWTITVKQSNKNGDEAIFTSNYRTDQISWYFDPRLGSQGQQTGGKMSSEDANAYRKLLNTKVIAWASKLSDAERENMMASMDSAIKEGDKDYANEIIRGVMLSDKRVWDSIYDNEQLKSWLWLVRVSLEEFSKTGNTSVLRSMAEKVANYLGTTTDDQLAKANNQLWVLVADYIRAISGTAASDREVVRLINNMPNIKNVKSFNTTLLDNLEQIANTKMKTNIELFLWNYKNIAPSLFPEVYNTASANVNQTSQEVEQPATPYSNFSPSRYSRYNKQ